MSAVPPNLTRQSAYIDVRDAAVGPGNAGPGSFKDASDTKPYHLELVYGYNGEHVVKCKYDYIKKMWLDENDRQVLSMQSWSNIKNS